MQRLPAYDSVRKNVDKDAGGEIGVSSDAINDDSEQSPLLQWTPANKRPSETSGRTQYSSCKTVRFQVVVWYIGPIGTNVCALPCADMSYHLDRISNTLISFLLISFLPDAVLNIVTMKFRLTIFWNAPQGKEHDAMALGGYGTYDETNKRVWTMHGRQRAYQRELSEILPGSRLVYVPPISILNAVDFNILGDPEVCLVNADNQVMKWTCMYKATLIQDQIRVSQFPHDKHELVLKLGIMKHRQADKRWDKAKWKLGLATAQDSQRTIRIPHGLVVDHVKIPEFSFDRSQGLVFEILPLLYGAESSADECLTVKLAVKRESGYYDKNIIPLLAMLNFVGVSTLVLDATEFGSRGEILLAVAFVAIGIRMTVDSKLPNVGYQIKLQRILNEFFYLLLALHIESSIIYALLDRYGWSEFSTTMINDVTMILALIYNGILLANYYWDWGAERFALLRSKPPD